MSDHLPSLSLHPRQLGENRYVYAVHSRRARGISVGINLNPDKICNFDCIYCQVDRTRPPEVRDVDEARLMDELEAVLRRGKDGTLFREPRFADVPAERRRLADVSFAGDGEPTTYPRFLEVVRQVVLLKQRLGLDGLKIAVLTNATVLERPAVREALAILDGSDGEIWAKLDAGTEDYYEQVCVPGGARFRKILANLLEAARLRPLVIQSLFLKLRGVGPSEAEIDSYAARLREIVEQGGAIKLVQIYTVARRPPTPEVEPLPDEEVDALVERVRRDTSLRVEGFYGSRTWTA